MNRKRVYSFRDIDNNEVKRGDTIISTQEYANKYGRNAGEMFYIADIYEMNEYPGEVLGDLIFVDGGGSRWNSELCLYRKVEK